MVEAFMAGLACLRCLRFFLGEGVARVAGVATGDAEAAVGLRQTLDLGLGLGADLVAAAAALLALD
jgi:hypothetical protein